MRSYRDNLAARLSSARGRACDMAPRGLDLGARRVEPSEAEERISAVAETTDAVEVDPGRGFSEDSLRLFLSAEKDLLRETAGRLRDSARSGEVPMDCRALLERVDYTWLHFPDEGDLDRPERSFLARAAVAASWYADRIERLGSVL